jgi:hypothetical protein
MLLPSMDLLGYAVTPEGLMMQPAKLEELANQAVPDTPDEIRKFLGAVAFLRRFVPRLSLLGAPMTAVLKKADKVQGKAKQRGMKRGPGYTFTEEDRTSVEDSFHAIVSHLSSSAVVAGPDLEDPLAEFVLVTDACDVAVGGSLLQWQHPSGRGPGPPEGTTVRNLDSKDPVQSSWRTDKGWTLKVIGYYSKTLADSQKNYTAFDKEAAAILLCVRSLDRPDHVPSHHRVHRLRRRRVHDPQALSPAATAEVGDGAWDVPSSPARGLPQGSKQWAGRPVVSLPHFPTIC